MYDFDSIMHYGNYLFSKNKKMTMVALKNPNLLFGQTLRLSKTDILQLNAVYDCESKCYHVLHITLHTTKHRTLGCVTGGRIVRATPRFAYKRINREGNGKEA